MTIESATVDKEDVERFSRIAEEWWDENGKFKPLHRLGPVRIQYIRDQVVAHFERDDAQIKVLEGLTVLDVGCGGGLVSEPLTRLGAKVTGIDASEKNIAVASLHAQQSELNINYMAATPEALAAQGEGFVAYDIVLALEIVEHVADVDEFLKACARLVKPGGLLLMSTLNRTIKSYALAIVGAEYVLRWLPRGTHQWQKFLKPSELCGGLRKQGLTIEHMTGIVFDPLKNTWATDDKDVAVNYMLTAAS